MDQTTISPFSYDIEMKGSGNGKAKIGAAGMEEGPGALTAKKRKNKSKGKNKALAPEGAAVAATDDELSKIDGNMNSFMGNSAQAFHPPIDPIDADSKKIAANANISKGAMDMQNNSRQPSIDIEGADPNAATANNGALPVIPPIGS